MNSIQLFTYADKDIRTTLINGGPWFVATDVCNVLDLSNPTMVIGRLDEDERSKFNLGRQGEGWCVNEYGLYNLILASRKPEAKEFKRWITHEVIPSIRKHGIYATDEVMEKMLASPEFGIRLLTEIQNERQARIEAEEKNRLNAPKVLFANAVSAATTSILVGDLAKILKQNGIDIGANRLFVWLRENGYLIKREGMDYNSPTQTSMDMGLFSIKETAITHSDGHVSISKTTKVTGKGQQYFINKFLRDREALA